MFFGPEDMNFEANILILISTLGWIDEVNSPLVISNSR